ncbi:MAG: HDOD domain-containing protein [Campylobacterales bacterium]|nr:HDOD domain-containing protein [Campylobacterales bacterium]
MIQKKEIEDFLNKIPPIPENLKKCLNELNSGNLKGAADVAKNDLALSSHLRNIINKPIFGLRTEIKDVNQIFSTLGLGYINQIIRAYMMKLIIPKNWEFFKMSQSLFEELQIELMKEWNKLLTSLKIEDKEIIASIAILPASIIVCEEIFKSRKSDFLIIRETSDIDYNTILKRMTNMDIFDVCNLIADKWNLSENTKEIISLSSGKIDTNTQSKYLTVAKYMHLLLFYELSQSKFIKANLNDFIDFNPEFVSDIFENFQKVVVS